MGEPNNTVSRGRKRKASKSNTKSYKRKASTSSTSPTTTNDSIVKQEPLTASPVSLSKSLELSTAEISQYTSSSNDDLQHSTRSTLETPYKKNLTDIPNEIFVQICANLPPSDLFSLTLVCKKLKGLLCSPGSKETQAIWRNSRLRFMRFLQYPPPHNMDEKSYIVLKQMDKGCQFCNEKNFVKVYWEFRVRCCESCLDEKTMSRDKLYIDENVPIVIFKTLPHIFRDASQIYWTNDVIKASNEYFNLQDEEKQDWIDQKEDFVSRMMQEIMVNKQEEQSEHFTKLEENFMAQSINPNYMPQAPTQQKRVFIRQPQLSTAPINVPTMTSMTSVSPMVNMVSTPTIPSMGLTNPQPQFQQFQQFNQIIPHMMNRSQFMITAPPAQQLFPQQSFVPRITRQIISPPQQIIPSHLMTGAPQHLSQHQILPPQMASPHCFGAPQFPHY